MITSFLNSNIIAQSVLTKTVKELGGRDGIKGKSSVVVKSTGGPGTDKVGRGCRTHKQPLQFHATSDSWNPYSKFMTNDLHVIILPFYMNKSCKPVIPRCTKGTVNFPP